MFKLVLVTSAWLFASGCANKEPPIPLPPEEPPPEPEPPEPPPPPLPTPLVDAEAVGVTRR